MKIQNYIKIVYLKNQSNFNCIRQKNILYSNSMGTIFHLLTLYSSLYKVSIDFEEINLYTYEFTIKNLVKTDNKIIKF